jgi:lysozyme
MAETNCIVDLSHHNAMVDLAAAKNDGIAAIFQKATEGTHHVDPSFAPNRRAAVGARLLFGAYHFGTGSDGIHQAEHFLETVDPGPADLLALDFEGNPQGPSMTLEEARAFVTHVKEKTGRWPGLYSGHYIKELLQSQADSVLAQCWFWLAQYGPTPVVPANWPSWTLWQYTDGALGAPPHDVAGIGRCDRDKFNGSEAQLRHFWNGDQNAGSNPTTAPVMPEAMVPETSAFSESSTTSWRRSGIMPEIPAIMIPTEPKLAKPHMA